MILIHSEIEKHHCSAQRQVKSLEDQNTQLVSYTYSSFLLTCQLHLSVKSSRCLSHKTKKNKKRKSMHNLQIFLLFKDSKCEGPYALSNKQQLIKNIKVHNDCLTSNLYPYSECQMNSENQAPGVRTPEVYKPSRAFGIQLSPVKS